MMKPIQNQLFQTESSRRDYKFSLPNMIPLLLMIVLTGATYIVNSYVLSTQQVAKVFRTVGLRVADGTADFFINMYRMFTNVFFHMNLMHLVFNLFLFICLWIISTHRIYKSKALILTTIITMLTTGVAYQWLGNTTYVSVGLSGVNYAILGLILGGVIIDRIQKNGKIQSKVQYWYILIFSFFLILDTALDIVNNYESKDSLITNLRGLTNASVTHLVGAITGLLIAFLLKNVQSKASQKKYV